MADIFKWPHVTRLPTSVSTILENAGEADLAEIVIVGFTKNGEEYFGSSEADGGNVLWCLERAKHKLLTFPDDASY